MTSSFHLAFNISQFSFVMANENQKVENANPKGVA